MNLPDPGTNQASGGGISPKAIVGIVIAALAILFILQNRDRVQIDFLVLSFGSPLWLILIIMVILGALLDRFVIKGFKKSRDKNT